MIPLETRPSRGDFVFVGIFVRSWLFVTKAENEIFTGIDLDSGTQRVFKKFETAWGEISTPGGTRIDAFSSPLYLITKEEGLAVINARKQELNSAAEKTATASVEYNTSILPVLTMA